MAEVKGSVYAALEINENLWEKHIEQKPNKVLRKWTLAGMQAWVIFTSQAKQMRLIPSWGQAPSDHMAPPTPQWPFRSKSRAELQELIPKLHFTDLLPNKFFLLLCTSQMALKEAEVKNTVSVSVLLSQAEAVHGRQRFLFPKVWWYDSNRQRSKISPPTACLGISSIKLALKNLLHVYHGPVL